MPNPLTDDEARFLLDNWDAATSDFTDDQRNTLIQSLDSWNQSRRQPQPPVRRTPSGDAFLTSPEDYLKTLPAPQQEAWKASSDISTDPKADLVRNINQRYLSDLTGRDERDVVSHYESLRAEHAAKLGHVGPVDDNGFRALVAKEYQRKEKYRDTEGEQTLGLVQMERDEALGVLSGPTAFTYSRAEGYVDDAIRNIPSGTASSVLRSTAAWLRSAGQMMNADADDHLFKNDRAAYTELRSLQGERKRILKSDGGVAARNARLQEIRSRIQELHRKGQAMKAASGYESASERMIEAADAVMEFEEFSREVYDVDPEFAASFAGSVTNGIGQMVGQVPAYFINPAFGTALISGDVFESNYQRYRKAMPGADPEEAYAYAFVRAVPETALETIGIDQLVQRAFGQAGKLTFRELVKRMGVAGAAKATGAGAVAEGMTGLGSEVTSDISDYLSINPEVWDQEVWYETALRYIKAAAAEAIAGGVVASGGAVAQASEAKAQVTEHGQEQIAGAVKDVLKSAPRFGIEAPPSPPKLRAYHGTRQTLEGEELTVPKEGLINQRLGVHFAKDPRVTDAFTIGVYAEKEVTSMFQPKADELDLPPNERGVSRRIKAGGRIIPVDLDIKNPLVLENKGTEMDQTTIARAVMNFAYRRRPELFVQHLESLGFTEEQWQEQYNEEYKDRYSDPLEAFLNNYGEPFAADFVDEIVEEFKANSGYDAIIYQNTSPNEIYQRGEYERPFIVTSYIIFEPKQITHALTNPPILNVPEIQRAARNAQAAATARREAVEEVINGFHGTPHTIEGTRFLEEKVGTGEGVAAFGWGVAYVAEEPKTAATYKRDVQAIAVDGKPALEYERDGSDAAKVADYIVSYDGVKNALVATEGRMQETNDLIQRFVDEGRIDEGGNLYRVRINAAPEQFLDWDKPLGEQSEYVRERLRPLIDDLINKTGEGIAVEQRTRPAVINALKNETATGEQIYKWAQDQKTPLPDPGRTAGGWGELQYAYQGAERASKYLASLGIKGNRYLDQLSREEGEGTYNYVVFEESTAEIVPEGQQSFASPEEAQAAGYEGPFYHGSPDFEGEQFDLEHMGMFSGVSRGGISFTKDKTRAEAYRDAVLSDETVRLQEAVRIVNQALPKLEEYTEAQAASLNTQTGYDAETLELDDRVIDSWDDFVGIADTLGPWMQKQGFTDAARAFEAAKKLESRGQRPRLLEVYLKNPRTEIQEQSGETIYLVDDLSQIAEIVPEGEGAGEAELQDEGSEDTSMQLGAISENPAAKAWNRYMRGRGLMPVRAYAAKEAAVGEESQILKQAEFIHKRLTLAMRKHLKIKLFPKTPSQMRRWRQLDQLINNYLTNPDVPSSELPAAIRPVAIEARNHIDELSQRMIDEGVVDERLAKVFGQNLGRYLNRSYRLYTDPRWAKKVPEGVRLKMKDRILRENPGMPDAEAEGYVNALLFNQAGSPMEVLADMGKKVQGLKDLGILEKRQDLSAELRALWGENREATENYVRSVQKMAKLIGSHQFLSEFREIGLAEGWLSERPVGETARQFAFEEQGRYSRELAPLNGLFTTPEIYNAMVDEFSPYDINLWMRALFIGNVGAKISKTVLSIVTQTKNFTSNIFITTRLGNLPVKDLGTATKTVMQDLAPQFVLDALSSETGKAAFQERYLHYVKRGVIEDSVAAGELNAIFRDALQGKHSLEEFINNRIAAGFKKGVSTASKFYQAGDAFWKIINYEAEKRKYRRAKPDWTNEQVERMAARVVRDLMPTYSKIPKALQELRRFPFIAPFVSFTSEMWRNNKNQFKLIEEEMRDPDTRVIGARRLAGYAATRAFFVALAAYLRHVTDTDEEDVQAIREMAAPWDANGILLPMGQTEVGHASYLNASSMDPDGNLVSAWNALIVREGPMDERAIGMIQQLAEPFIGEELFTQAAMDVWRNQRADSGSPVYDEQGTVREAGIQALKHLFKPVTPGAYEQMKRLYMGITGEPTHTGRTYDPEAELLAMTTGARVSSIDPEKALYFRGKEIKDQIGKANYVFLRHATTRGRLKPDNLAPALEEMEKRRKLLFAAATRKTHAAMRLGLSADEADGILKEGGFNQKEREAIIAGEYIPYVLTDHYYKQLAEQDRIRSIIKAVGRDILPTKHRSRSF